MAGNSWGQQFRVTTCGESHGPALMAIVDGCPPGIPLCEADFEKDIARRRTGTSRFTSQRHEADQVEILSGVFEGETTGTPIGLLIRNTDQRSKDYEAVKNTLRPGHADFTYQAKYGRRDYRGGGRASARETVMRVAAGVIAKKILQEQSVVVRSCVSGIGSIETSQRDWSAVEGNPFFFPDLGKTEAIEAALTQARRDGDSLGARLFVEANGVPAGWGEPVFSKLSADLAAAMMGINAVKAVEIGDGFEAARARGVDSRDVITPEGFESNHAGGVLGGISTGQPITMSVAFKPTSSLTTPIDSITDEGQPATVVTKGRHDPCVGIRAVPIVEAMMALTLVDHMMRHRAQIQA